MPKQTSISMEGGVHFDGLALIVMMVREHMTQSGSPKHSQTVEKIDEQIL